MVRKTALSAHSTNSQQARGRVERQSRGACDSLMLLPTLSPPGAQNKMACNSWDNPTSPDLTQPMQTSLLNKRYIDKLGVTTPSSRNRNDNEL